MKNRNDEDADDARYVCMHDAGTEAYSNEHFFWFWFDLKSHHIDKIAEEKRFDRVEQKKNEEQ